jgi:hypothetical protein
MDDDVKSVASTKSFRSSTGEIQTGYLSSESVQDFISRWEQWFENSSEENSIREIRSCLRGDVLLWIKNNIDSLFLLHKAVNLKKNDILKELIELGANIEELHENLSILQAACQKGNTEGALLILKYKPQLRQNADGNTELMLLVLNQQTETKTSELIKKLLECGTNLNESNKSGKTAMDIASDAMKPVLESNQSVSQLAQIGYEQIIKTSSANAEQPLTAQYKLKNFYIPRFLETFKPRYKIGINWYVDDQLTPDSGFWVESEGIQSLTAAHIASFRNEKILTLERKIPANVVILDGTASSGADTLSFLYNFKGTVISCELEDYTCKMLDHNSRLMKKMLYLDHTLHRTRLGDVQDFVKDQLSSIDNELFETVQMIYLDLPWGGNFQQFVPELQGKEKEHSYKSELDIMLKVGNTNLDEFVAKCFEKRSNLTHAVLKLPMNFDRKMIQNLWGKNFTVHCYRIFEQRIESKHKRHNSLKAEDFQEKMIFAVVEKSSSANNTQHEIPLFLSRFSHQIHHKNGTPSLITDFQNGLAAANEKTTCPGYPLYRDWWIKRKQILMSASPFWYNLNEKLEFILQFL